MKALSLYSIHMKRCFLICFFVLAAFIISCNKDNVIEQPEDGKPQIELDSESGIYTIKIGRELKITPTFKNVENALYAWTIDGNLVSKEPTFSYTWDKLGDVFVQLRVDTDKGTAKEEIKVEVIELTPPVISIVTPAKGLKVLRGSDYTFSPDIQHKDLEGFKIEWVRNGEVVSTDTSYTFHEESVGLYTITVNASNIDGSTTKDLKLDVVETIPYSVAFTSQSYREKSTDRCTFANRPIFLRPLIECFENPYFEWSVNGDRREEHGRVFKFIPTSPGEYEVECAVRENLTATRVTRNITRGGSSISASVKVVCVASSEAEGLRSGGVSRFSNKVYEYTPAPGQFINETGTFGGMTGNETTPDAADAWAEARLKKRTHVSLGSWGGYIIVGFDHSIVNTNGGYDFAIQGNAFKGSSEPGIVWVMQDANRNGLPDDEWYELRGSETGKPGTTQQYEVTYFKPAGKGMDVRWEASDGRTGCVDYLAQFHKQDYYYPAWISEESYTLIGTHLKSNNVKAVLWENRAYAWGYADNYGNDQLIGGNTVDGSGQRNGFKISNAMNQDGSSVELMYIDFIKVQCGVLATSGPLGENSTEVCAFEDLNWK